VTEVGVQEVVCHRRVVIGINVQTVRSDELPKNHQVNIEIDICLADTQYDIWDVGLINRGCGFLVHGPRTQGSTPIVYYLECVKLGFRHHARHPELTSGHKMTLIGEVCPVL
jgi:hypothetical protein